MHYALRLLCCVCFPVQQSCSVQSSPFICVFLSQNPIREQVRHPFDSGLHFWTAEEEKEEEKEELGIFLGGVLRMEGVDVKRWLG